MDQELKQHIISLSERYETADFLPADPSSFMHKVKGEAKEAVLPKNSIPPRRGTGRGRPVGAHRRFRKRHRRHPSLLLPPLHPPPHAPAAHGLQPHVAGARKHERVCAAERRHWP